MINSDKFFTGSVSGNYASDHLRSFFLSYLRRIYCIKYHLIERLPDLAEQASLNDLQTAMLSTLDNIIKQIHRIDKIFDVLGAESSIDDCEAIIAMIEDLFTEIYINFNRPQLRDLAILYYVVNLESLETSYFQILQMVAIELKNEEVSQLLQGNMDESKANRHLMQLLTKKCLSKY